jgi:DNA anti-recombination protein RmuC
MMNTIERTITNVNDSVTERLDDLEQQLSPIPSKALAATRSSVRRVNRVVETTASSIWSRFENVESEASAAVATTTGQARSAADRVSASVDRSAKQTAGQARSAAKRTTDAVKRGVNETTGQARSGVDASTKAVKRGVAEVTGQAVAQTRRTTDAVTEEVEGALDDAKVATEPSSLVGLSKAELYEKAQELDIDGRSGMTKAELIGAIQKA